MANKNHCISIKLTAMDNPCRGYLTYFPCRVIDIAIGLVIIDIRKGTEGVHLEESKKILTFELHHLNTRDR